jgi:hypothetical protein
VDQHTAPDASTRRRYLGTAEGALRRTGARPSQYQWSFARQQTLVAEMGEVGAEVRSGPFGERTCPVRTFRRFQGGDVVTSCRFLDVLDRGRPGDSRDDRRTRVAMSLAPPAIQAGQT